MHTDVIRDNFNLFTPLSPFLKKLQAELVLS